MSDPVVKLTMTRRKRPLAGLVLCVLFGVAIAPAAAARDNRCAVPAELLRLGEPLPKFWQKLSAKQPMRIVAIGSSSTAGSGSSKPAFAYPAQFETMLRAYAPGVAISVENLGRGGENALQTAGRINADVMPRPPDLVLWQLGANDAMRDMPLEPFVATVDATLGRLREAGVETVLLPPQWAPRVLAAPHLSDYLEAINRVAAKHHIALFRRFEIGKLAKTGLSGDPGDSMVSGDGLHHTDLGYQCLAQQLLESIAASADPALQAAR